MSKVILSVLAHPDDAEFLCAGTLLRLQREHGWTVHIASMTPGDCGSADKSPEAISTIRRAESHAAAALMEATYHCVEERDLLIFYQERTLERVTRLLRVIEPDVVITHSPDDYHVDHEMTSLVVRAATFAAPAPNFMNDRGHGSVMHHIPHLYYCDPLEGKNPMGEAMPPHFCIDVSSVIDEKQAMLAAHASQREWLMKHHGVDQYLNAMRAWGTERGKLLGVAYAEGFRQHRGHSYPQDNVLGQLLSR